jgi:hypothetical protein
VGRNMGVHSVLHVQVLCLLFESSRGSVCCAVCAELETCVACRGSNCSVVTAVSKRSADCVRMDGYGYYMVGQQVV